MFLAWSIFSSVLAATTAAAATMVYSLFFGIFASAIIFRHFVFGLFLSSISNPSETTAHVRLLLALGLQAFSIHVSRRSGT
jgi:hypothetical protein